ncbi:hypothetical protein [Rhizorhabdus argentea]|uniref:hypothetical protein n=1 Tax=Rhizorhabdus argentea TaxID=1387174 RepID=UPI0030EE9118
MQGQARHDDVTKAAETIAGLWINCHSRPMSNFQSGHHGIRALLHSNVRWIKSVGSPRWIATYFGDRFELSMNDFPDERLYTLRWRGEQLDLDDAPPLWTIPRD